MHPKHGPAVAREWIWNSGGGLAGLQVLMSTKSISHSHWASNPGTKRMAYELFGTTRQKAFGAPGMGFARWQ